MLDILMVAPFDPKGRYKGGIASVVNNLCASDAVEQQDVNIIKFDTCRIDRENGTEAALNNSNIKNALAIYKDLPLAVNESKPDVLYYHTSVGLALLKDLLILRNVKKKTRIPTVIHIHFADYDKIMTGNGVLDSVILKIMQKYVDHIVFLSVKTKEQFAQHGIDEKKCSVVYNFSTLEYAEAELFENKNEKTDGVQFLFVGSIDERKGIFDALAVFENISADFTLHICGACAENELKVKFEDYLKKLGNKIEFHGFIAGEEKLSLFKKADVLILPSYGEGLPVVILEALSAGCGVISTDVGAIPEVVTEDNGIIVSPGKLPELEKAINSYINMDKADLLNQQKQNYAEAKQYTIPKFLQGVVKACKSAQTRCKKK